MADRPPVVTPEARVGAPAAPAEGVYAAALAASGPVVRRVVEAATRAA
ncbi:MAG: hypothetical protein ACJ8F1_25520 [Polyangia bacterium]